MSPALNEEQSKICLSLAVSCSSVKSKYATRFKHIAGQKMEAERRLGVNQHFPSCEFGDAENKQF